MFKINHVIKYFILLVSVFIVIGANAFDLEDYAGSYREARNALGKAQNMLRLAQDAFRYHDCPRIYEICGCKTMSETCTEKEPRNCKTTCDMKKCEKDCLNIIEPCIVESESSHKTCDKSCKNNYSECEISCDDNICTSCTDKLTACTASCAGNYKCIDSCNYDNQKCTDVCKDDCNKACEESSNQCIYSCIETLNVQRTACNDKHVSQKNCSTAPSKCLEADKPLIVAEVEFERASKSFKGAESAYKEATTVYTRSIIAQSDLMARTVTEKIDEAKIVFEEALRTYPIEIIARFSPESESDLEYAKRLQDTNNNLMDIQTKYKITGYLEQYPNAYITDDEDFNGTRRSTLDAVLKAYNQLTKNIKFYGYLLKHEFYSYCKNNTSSDPSKIETLNKTWDDPTKQVKSFKDCTAVNKIYRSYRDMNMKATNELTLAISPWKAATMAHLAFISGYTNSQYITDSSTLSNKKQSAVQQGVKSITPNHIIKLTPAQIDEIVQDNIIERRFDNLPFDLSGLHTLMQDKTSESYLYILELTNEKKLEVFNKHNLSAQYNINEITIERVVLAVKHENSPQFTFYELSAYPFTASTLPTATEGIIGNSIMSILGGSTYLLYQKNAEQLAANKTAMQALVGELSSLINSSNCLISWKRKLSANATTAVNTDLQWSKNIETVKSNGEFKFDVTQYRYCLALDTELNITKTDSELSNETKVQVLKGAATLRYGLTYNDGTTGNFKWLGGHNSYVFFTLGKANSVNKSTDSESIIETVANATQYVLGAGIQSNNTTNFTYDISTGFYITNSDATTSGVNSEAESSGSASAANLEWDFGQLYTGARARYTTGEEISTTFTFTLGWKFTDALRIQVSFQRAKVDETEDRALKMGLVYDLIQIN